MILIGSLDGTEENTEFYDFGLAITLVNSGQRSQPI